MSGSVSQKTGELAAAAKERIQEWTTEAGSFTKRAATDLGERAASISSQLTTAAGDQLREFRSSSSPTSVSDIVAATRDLGRPVQQAINDPETRDKLLLGTAGAAIVAALGIALQRRFSEGDRSM